MGVVLEGVLNKNRRQLKMTEPQLLFLHEGVFRPGRIVPYTESNYIGLDLKRNALLGDEKINPKQTVR